MDTVVIILAFIFMVWYLIKDKNDSHKHIDPFHPFKENVQEETRTMYHHNPLKFIPSHTDTGHLLNLRTR
jgi:hypothetical protein